MKVGSPPSIGTVSERFLLKIPSSEATCDLFVPLKKYPTALNNISLVLSTFLWETQMGHQFCRYCHNYEKMLVHSKVDLDSPTNFRSCG